MLIETNQLIIRKLERDDSTLLSRWLSDPTILEFYEGRDNPFDEEKVQRTFYDRNTGTKRCIVEYRGTPIGYIQYYEVDSEERKIYGYEKFKGTIYGMDQFIGESSYWNKGIGTLLVNSMVTYLVEKLKADLIVMDPQVWNERAIRCYEKCGFRKVKLLPKQEYHEGEYRDCWLIEYRAN